MMYSLVYEMKKNIWIRLIRKILQFFFFFFIFFNNLELLLVSSEQYEHAWQKSAH